MEGGCMKDSHDKSRLEELQREEKELCKKLRKVLAEITGLRDAEKLRGIREGRGPTLRRRDLTGASMRCLKTVREHMQTIHAALQELLELGVFDQRMVRGTRIVMTFGSDGKFSMIDAAHGSKSKFAILRSEEPLTEAQWTEAINALDDGRGKVLEALREAPDNELPPDKLAELMNVTYVSDVVAKINQRLRYRNLPYHLMLVQRYGLREKMRYRLYVIDV